VYERGRHGSGGGRSESSVYSPRSGGLNPTAASRSSSLGQQPLSGFVPGSPRGSIGGGGANRNRKHFRVGDFDDMGSEREFSRQSSFTKQSSLDQSSSLGDIFEGSLEDQFASQDKSSKQEMEKKETEETEEELDRSGGSSKDLLGLNSDPEDEWTEPPASEKTWKTTSQVPEQHQKVTQL